MSTESQSFTWRRWTAWGLWLFAFTVIMADVVRRPYQHTTMQTYRLASTQWWAGQDPYSFDPHSGFLYFPQAAFLFTPFNVVPFAAGEILWRIATFGLFFYALHRLNDVFLSKRGMTPEKSFLLLTLLAVPSSLASLRNAQFDLPLAALVVLTAAEVALKRWNAATAWICLAVALKPLAVVPILLYSALYWKLIPRIAIGMVIVILLPFLHWNPAFVAHEYARCFEILAWASKGDEPKYSDLCALLSHCGYDAPLEVKTPVRVLFALIYLGIGFVGVRRLKPIEAAWLIGALSTDYLMLFNPRTETCSFVFLGPFTASLAIFHARVPHRKWLAYFLGFASLGLACDAFPQIYTLSIHGMTDRWFKPLMALLFFPVLIWFIFDKEKSVVKSPSV